MHLKSIEIHGFKSFANKAVLAFLPPRDEKNSITAIVGPNGAGKSNISDAIRWVMGEQSMKTLRGKKGEDIIFSGSEAKGQMGMASVSITLDNSDKRADLEYEELVITRRYYRSGESEYLINGNTVRLLDLQLLLAKAQFGQGAYSVIGQGMIDRLLLQTPQERKEFFDEASGIKEFQIKRHQAGLKLHRTKENMAQADLLLNEVEPRLRALSRQVKKLERRQEIEIELREAHEQYYFTVYEHNQSNLNELTAELLKVNKEFNESNQKLTIVQNELAGLARETSRQGQFEALQRAYQEIVHKKNVLERERAILQGRLQIEYSRAGQQNVGWLQSKTEELKKEQIRRDKELLEAESVMNNATENILKQQKVIEDVSVERTEVRARIAGLEQKLLQAKGEQTYWQFSGLKAVQAILEERHRLGNVYGTVAQLGEVEEKYRMALDVAGGAYLTAVVVDSDRTAQASIEYLRQHQLGVATLLPLNKIKPRFVASDIKDLINRDGVHGMAVDLVKFGSKFSDVFSYVLGNTLVVDNVDVAREIGIGRVRMVTLQGDILEMSGSMKGGWRQVDKRKGMGFSHGDSPYLAQSQLAEGEEKLDDLQKQLVAFEESYEKAQAELREYQAQAQISTSRTDMIGTQKQELDKEIAGLEQELSLYSLSKEDYNASLGTVKKQKEDFDKQIIVCEKELKTAEEKLEKFNRAEEAKKQRIFALQDEMQSEQQILNKIVDNRNEKQVSIAKLETKQEDLANEVYQEMHSTLLALVERGIASLSLDQLDETQQKIQKLKYQLSLIGGIEEEVVKEYEEIKQRYDNLVSQLTDLKKAYADLEIMTAELDSVMKKKRDKAFKQIKKEFARYFELLFEGGKADLVELYGEVDETGEGISEDLENNIGVDSSAQVYPEHGRGAQDDSSAVVPRVKKVEVLLGIDIQACPPGKKIKNIQALSGGERTMTSIALVCAILHTNPSPFVVLDEVEAALDEANIQRFIRILSELSKQSQFIIITHNRATMHSADVLYGVTMGNDGISHLLSVKLNEAEKIVE